jgi:hypothetical protein
MQTRVDELILRKLMGKLNDNQEVELNNFMARSEDNRRLVEDLTNPHTLFDAIMRHRALDVEKSLQEAKERLGFNDNIKQ